MATTTVTGTYLDPSNNPCSGRVVFRLVAATYQDGLAAIFPTVPKQATLDTNGDISVELEPTSGVDAAFDATDMTYQVIERINGTERDAYYVDIPTAPAVDLGTLATYDDPLTVRHLSVDVDLSDLGYAVAPVAGDGVQYVAASGNDAHDGLSWGKAKLTVQAAINALSSGGTVYIGQGTFTVATTITLANNLTFIGAGRELTILRSTNVDLISVTASVSSVNFRSLKLLSTASHIIDVDAGKYLSQCSWMDVAFEVDATGKSAINMPDGEFIGNLVEFCTTTHSLSATVPTFNLLSSSSAINGNTFRRMVCYYSGDYVFRVEASGVTGFCYDNTFEDIIFEVTEGGCIDLASARNVSVRTIGIYDMGTTTKDMFKVRKNATASASRYVTFQDVTRRGGTLGASLKDINIASGSAGNILMNCDTSTSSGYVVDLNFTSALIIGGNATVEDRDYANIIRPSTLASGWNTTGNRPTMTADDKGAQFYDTTLAKPVWWTGTVWKDAAGTTV